MTNASAENAPQSRHIGRINRIGLWSLFLRDLLRGLDIWKITIAAPALQSLLFAFVFQLALGGASVTMGGLDFNTFLVPGLIAYVALERGFESTAYMMVYDKLEGMITDIIGSPLTSTELVTGFTVMAAVSAVITGAATWIILLPFLGTAPANPVAVVFFAFAGGAMLGLVGLIGGLWADKWDHITGVQTFIIIPALFMSGVFFSLDRLSEGFRLVAELNPAWYVIDGIRYGLTGAAVTDPWTGCIVVLVAIAALWIVCWRLFVSGYKLKP